jgi:hypothetical protein
MRPLARLHGRKGAILLFGISLVFSFFTSFQFDLVGEEIVDIFNPIVHAKDLLARKLADATQPDRFAIAPAQWEATYDAEPNYRRCALNQPLERPTHGCVTDPDTRIPYCQLRNLRIDTSKISGPWGGEPLNTAMGRDEDVEIPKYYQGAFSIQDRLTLSDKMSRDYWFYLLEVFLALDVNRRQKCETTLTGISLILTRYEYVDMYHTLKDLWNAFMALPEGVEKVDRVIFLDSHAQGYLDSIWQDLFGPTVHIHHIKEGTCLEQAIFVPPGYSSVLNPLGRLFKGNRCNSMSNTFIDFVVKSYGLENIKAQEGSVLILDHVKHIDHPRSIPEEHHDNANLVDMHAKILDETQAINVQVVDMHRLSFKAQLKLVRQAQIMIGYRKQGSVDGSQLALLMFLQEGANIIEIRDMGNIDMQNIARWRPEVEYRPVFSSGPLLVEYDIVPTVKDILTPGWDVGSSRHPRPLYQDLPKHVDGDDDIPGFYSEQDGIEEEDVLSGWYSSPIEFDESKDYRECAMFGPSTRPLHGCVVDTDTKIPYCQLENFRIDSSKIDSSPGGEYVDTVLGRDESLEIPKYSHGALTVEKDVDQYDGVDRSMFFYLDDMLAAISTAPAKSCVRTVSTPTLFITRYEYVSLSHTLSDLWNAFMVMPKENPKKVNVVFLDAHAEGFLDSVWKDLFGKYDRVKQLPEGGVCYKKAIFIPAGYSSTLTPQKRLFRSKPCPSMTNAFVDFVLRAYSLEKEVVDQGRVTILDRVPFASHPRSDLSKETRAISNLDVLELRVKRMTNATEVKIVDLQQIPFLDQIREMRRSHIVIGHSEAGISQLIFMQDGTHVFEFGAMHVAPGIAEWKTGLTCRTLGDIQGNTLNEYSLDSVLIPAVNYALNRQDELKAGKRGAGDSTQ